MIKVTYMSAVTMSLLRGAIAKLAQVIIVSVCVDTTIV